MIAVWLVLAILSGALVAVGAMVLLGGRAHAAVFPYYAAFACKVVGLSGLAARRIGLRYGPLKHVADDTLRTLARHRVENFVRIREAFQALDELPTVRRGLAALRLKSSLDAQIWRKRRDLPPYTHPRQRPYFFIPGVPAQEYYDAGQFEWTSTLERAYPVIAEELRALLETEERSRFKSYSGEFGYRVPGWNTFNLFLLDERVEVNCARCPRTTEVLESLPRFAHLLVMFSALNPGRWIGQHCGPMNGLLRAHLPLIVPEGCGLLVGRKEGTWQEGKVLVFDDSFEHEVWNNGNGLRVVLFLSFWHPCFSAHELPVLERLRRVLSSEILLHGEWKLRQERESVSTIETDHVPAQTIT